MKKLLLFFFFTNITFCFSQSSFYSSEYLLVPENMSLKMNNNKPTELSGFVVGGEEGIRTPETVSRLHAFQACALSHSATSPKSKQILKFCILCFLI